MANRGYLVGEEFAEKLRDTVARVQGTPQGSPDSKLPAIFDEGPQRGSPHYLSKTTTAWSKGTGQTLTLWGGTPGSEASLGGVTVVAYNYVANLPSGLWVVLSRANGTFYLTSFDYTGLSGYSASSQQILAHNTSGQLVWLNTTACT